MELLLAVCKTTQWSPLAHAMLIELAHLRFMQNAGALPLSITTATLGIYRIRWINHEGCGLNSRFCWLPLLCSIAAAAGMRVWHDQEAKSSSSYTT